MSQDQALYPLSGASEPQLRLISAVPSTEGFELSLDLSEYGDLAEKMASAFTDLLEAATAPNFLFLDLVDKENRVTEILVTRPGVTFSEADQNRVVGRTPHDESLGDYLNNVVEPAQALVLGNLLETFTRMLNMESADPFTRIAVSLKPKHSDPVGLRFTRTNLA